MGKKVSAFATITPTLAAACFLSVMLLSTMSFAHLHQDSHLHHKLAYKYCESQHTIGHKNWYHYQNIEKTEYYSSKIERKILLRGFSSKEQKRSGLEI